MHPLWQLMQKTDKSDYDKVLLNAVMLATTVGKYTSLTPEETFDALLADYNGIESSVKG